MALDEKQRKPKTPIEALFNEYIVPFSYPVNWKLYDQFKLKGYNHRDSLEAVLLFGYMASWQSFYTSKKKLHKGGYFFRARSDIEKDIGLRNRALIRAKTVLESEGLIGEKIRPGQASLFKINIKPAAKYLNRSQKDYATKHKRGNKPSTKCETSNGLELNGHSNEEGKGGETENQVSTLTFDDFKKTHLDKYKTYTCPVDEKSKDITGPINCIEYFLLQHEKHIGTKPGSWAKVLKADTWDKVFFNMMCCYEMLSYAEKDEGSLIALDTDEVRTMIDHYFTKQYKKTCDYSIVHFNDPEVKKVLYYDVIL